MYWSTRPGVDKDSAQRLKGLPPYTHTGLENGTAYYYVYTVDSLAGESTASNEIKITPAPAPPGAPQQLTVLPGKQRNTLSWLPPAAADITQEITYAIYWNTHGNVSQADRRLESLQSPFVHGELNNGTKYYYRVAVVVDGVEGALSGEITSAPRLSSLTPPQTVTVTAGNQQTTLAWSLVNDATEYVIYYNTAGDVGLDDPYFIVTQSPHVHTSLRNGVRYHYPGGGRAQ